jgi:hypothetical protein
MVPLLPKQVVGFVKLLPPIVGVGFTNKLNIAVSGAHGPTPSGSLVINS